MGHPGWQQDGFWKSELSDSGGDMDLKDPPTSVDIQASIDI